MAGFRNIKLVNRIQEFGAGVVLEANGAALAAAHACAERARETAPVADVDTAHGSRPGALRDSIRSEGEKAMAGNKEAFYAGWVNKGTVNMPPNGYWKKAVNKAKRDFYVSCGKANRGRRK